MDIIFVRHGQPQWAVDGLIQRDPSLTELGRQQADLAAQRIADDPREATELIVSPTRRSQQTAAPIADATGLVPRCIDDLAEIKRPDWEGITEEAVIEINRSLRHRSPEEFWQGLPGGESFRTFHNRVTTIFGALLADRGMARDAKDPSLWHVESDPGRIVIVAHAGTNSVCITHLLGIPPVPWEWERFVLFHASFTRLKMISLAGAHVPTLYSFNDQDHIPAGQRSR